MIDTEFEYVLKGIVKEFKHRHPEFRDLTSEELQDELWKNDSAIEFAHLILEKCEEFETDEIFG